MDDNILNQPVFEDIDRVCCFTGHRDLTVGEKELIKRRITITVKSLVTAGVKSFITGGAVGFDTVAAVTLINMKRRAFPDIRLAIVVPCRTQADKWSVKDRALYRLTLEAADKVICLSDRYTSKCMLVRDRYMVDNSSYCISYVKKAYGGSAYTQNYAKSKNKHIINLAEVDW